jgi:sortase (surface protein transpeptidase)
MRSDVTATLAVITGLALGAMVLSGRPPAQDLAPAVPSTTTEQSIPTPSADPPPDTLAPRRTSPSERTETIRPAIPHRLRIPSLGVDAVVVPIRTTSPGVLVPPNDYTKVGWWAEGPRPGSKDGTAIIAGHTVHTGGGAFDNLGDLLPGDTVIIDRRLRDFRYVVRRVSSYDKDALAVRAEKVLGADTEGRLALITCGDWTGSGYLSTVVVIACDPELVPPEGG